MIKLDAMENPYGLSGEARAEIAAAVANARINRYPGRRRRRSEGGAAPLACAARRRRARARQRLRRAAADADGGGRQARRRRAGAGPVVRAVPDVRGPRQPALRRRAAARRPDARHRRDAGGDRSATSRRWCGSRIRTTRPARCFRKPAIERIIRAAPGVVAVDEAYYAFADASFLPRVLEFPNLVVVRTLSKVGMAGVRLGYAAAHPAWIAELDKVRPPYNVNALTQAVVPVLLRTRRSAGRAGGGDPARARAAGGRAGRAAAGHRVPVARQFPARARARRRRIGSRRCGTLAFW